MSVCLSVCACVRVCVCACVRVCVRACDVCPKFYERSWPTMIQNRIELALPECSRWMGRASCNNRLEDRATENGSGRPAEQITCTYGISRDSGMAGFTGRKHNMHTDNMHTDNMNTDNMHTDNMHTDNMHTDNMHTDNMHPDNMHTDNMHPDSMNLAPVRWVQV